MVRIVNGQYSTIEAGEFGERLKNTLLKNCITGIPAGNVVVYYFLNKRCLMFETLEDLNVEVLSNSTLIGYEPGSITYFSKPLTFIPTLRFRDIRLPTKSELEIYLSRKTV